MDTERREKAIAARRGRCLRGMNMEMWVDLTRRSVWKETRFTNDDKTLEN